MNTENSLIVVQLFNGANATEAHFLHNCLAHKNYLK
jgi:hypothetical protein